MSNESELPISRVALEPASFRLVTIDVGQSADRMALKTAMEGRSRKMRDCGLQGIETIVERLNVCFRNATMIASPATTKSSRALRLPMTAYPASWHLRKPPFSWPELMQAVFSVVTGRSRCSCVVLSGDCWLVPGSAASCRRGFPVEPHPALHIVSHGSERDTGLGADNADGANYQSHGAFQHRERMLDKGSYRQFPRIGPGGPAWHQPADGFFRCIRLLLPAFRWNASLAYER